MATQYGKGPNLFALLVSGLVLVVGSLMAWMRVDAGDPGWLFAIPVVFAPITYAFLVRRKEERVVPTTTRGYTIHTPSFTDRTLVELLERVRVHGYQIAAYDLTRKAAPAPDAALRNCEIRLREQRAPEEYGDIEMRLNVRPDGVLLGYLEATDSQPGFYDEMAQFIIAELDELEQELEFGHSVGDGDRRPANVLRGELPKTPYGLSLLS